MNKTPETPDFDNPEWTEERAQKAVKFDALPDGLKSKLVSRVRGPQKTPVKVQVTIRFDPDVLDGLRATGKGWQTKANDALREWLRAHHRP